MKKIILVLALLIPSLVFAQNTGTPSTLRVKTDSNNSLLVTESAQVPPYTTQTFDLTRLKTDSSGNLVVAVTGGSATAVVYDVTQYSIACDSTNASAAMTTLLALVSAAGGGTIYFPPCAIGQEYRFDSQILIPNDAVAPQPSQVTFRFTGMSGGPQWYGVSTAVLDLRYTAVDGNAKIETRGLGTFGIDNLTLTDGGASNATPFLHSSNTTLVVNNDTFIGSGNVGQDAIVLGGTSTVLSGGVTAPFQGYGTRINNNHFRTLNRGLYGLNYANAITFSDNSFQGNVGTIAIELDGSNGGGQVDHGNVINNNTIEMDVYTYGIKLTSAQYNTFVGNQFFDPDASATAYYNLGATATQNIFICGYQPIARPTWAGTATSIQANTYLCTNSTGADSGTRGTQTSEFAYGLISKGTYDSTKVYSGQLVASDMFNPNENVSIGVDHTNGTGVIEAKNNATGITLSLNDVKKGDVTVPDLNVGGQASVNTNITAGASQSGDVFTVGFTNATANDKWFISASGTLTGRTNAGTKTQLVVADGASPAIRLSSTYCLGWNSTADLGGGAIDTQMCRGAAGLISPLASHAFGLVAKAWISTAPTISSGFGSSPSIVASNGTAAFTINVGGGGTASSGVIGLPAASTGWRVSCDDVTTQSSTVFITKQIATTTTSATITNYNTSAVASAWVASNILVCSAVAY